MNKKEPKPLTNIQKRVLKTVADIHDQLHPEEILFQHSVLCQTVLPYRDPGNDINKWTRTNGHAFLGIQATEAFNPATMDFEPVGLPFGPKARLILMHLNSEAIRTQSPKINVGDSMTAFIKRIGLSTDGRTIRAVKEQLRRLANAQITIGYAMDERAYQHKENIISDINLWFPKSAEQRVLWESTVRLSDDYFKSLVEHAVPFDERVIAAIKHNSMALDIYAWLTQRTFRIKWGEQVFISWKALWEQFGKEYKEIRMFRRAFRDALLLVKTCHKFNVQEVEGIAPTTAAGLFIEYSQQPVPSLKSISKRLEWAKKTANTEDPNDSKNTKKFRKRLKNHLEKPTK